MVELHKSDVSSLPPQAPPANHGHTVAAWFAMGGVMVGALVAGIGVVLASWPVAIIGAVVIVASLIGGAVLRALGYGQQRATR